MILVSEPTMADLKKTKMDSLKGRHSVVEMVPRMADG